MGNVDLPKIMVVSPSSFPGTTGDFASYFELLMGLSRKGLDVLLICPWHNDGRRFDELLNKKGIRVVRVPIRPPRLSSIGSSGIGISTAMGFLTFLTVEILVFLYVLVAYSPKKCIVRHSVLTFPLAPLLRLFCIRSIADGEILFHELREVLSVPDYALKVLRRFERVQSYSFFKVTTRSQQNMLLDFGFPSNHIILDTIGLNISGIPRYELTEIRAATFGYFGALEKWQGVDFLIRSFSDVVGKERSAILYVIGEGSFTSELIKEAEDLKISQNIVFCGAVPRNILWEKYFKMFRVAVIPRPISAGKHTLIPIKLVEALAAGKPVIATSVEGTEGVEGGVLYVQPNDDEMMAAAMLSLCRNDSLLLEMSHKALKSAQQFDIESRIERFLSVLTS